jgi:hypothetical protein
MDTFWWAIVIAILGLLGMASLIFFGYWLNHRWIFRRSPDIEMWLEHFVHNRMNASRAADLVQGIVEEHLARRNEFWTSYGQFVLSLIVMVFISILLLAKVISPEAGLPILSGVGGFAISKGVASAKGTTFRSSPRDKENE